MYKFVDPRDLNVTALAVCDRCKHIYAWDDLKPDGDRPGLRVCRTCWDEKDPYKLAPRRTEKVSVDHARPNVDLNIPGGADVDWSNA